MTSYTENLNLAKQDTGADGWGTVLNANFDKIDAGYGQVGVKNYSGTETYAAGEFVIASVNDVIGLYKSLQGNNVGHALTDTAWWEAVPLSGSADVDGKSITKNSLDELQTIGVINQNDTTTALKVWSGDEADLPATKDANTFYATEELGVNLLDVLYPIGSIYITTNVACPLSTLIAGSTWVLVGQDRVLQGAGTRGVVGTTLNESLPNITGYAPTNYWTALADESPNNCCTTSEYSKTATLLATGGIATTNWKIDASRSSSAYQDNAPVQPDAYLVNIYRRIS